MDFQNPERPRAFVFSENSSAKASCWPWRSNTSRRQISTKDIRSWTEQMRILWWYILLHATAALFGAEIHVTIDPSRVTGSIDLTRYALGQGGLADRPMFDGQVEQITQLHPQTIRVFVQEFFDLC